MGQKSFLTKDRQLSGSAFCWVRLSRLYWDGFPRLDLGLVMEDRPTELLCT